LNVILIGYRGAEKSATGKRIAKILGFKFVDTDNLIEQNAGLSIPEIFERFGEEHFRNLESKAIKEACSRDNHVIATGGGAPMRKENAANMKRNGIVILLNGSPEVIHSRISGDSNRPALTDLNDEFKEIKFMLEKRNPVYRALADFATDTSSKTIEENVSEIIAFLKERGVVGNAKG